jgi:hypothetical protein
MSFNFKIHNNMEKSLVLRMRYDSRSVDSGCSGNGLFSPLNIESKLLFTGTPAGFGAGVAL